MENIIGGTLFNVIVYKCSMFNIGMYINQAVLHCTCILLELGPLIKLLHPPLLDITSYMIIW